MASSGETVEEIVAPAEARDDGKETFESGGMIEEGELDYEEDIEEHSGKPEDGIQSQKKETEDGEGEVQRKAGSDLEDGELEDDEDLEEGEVKDNEPVAEKLKKPQFIKTYKSRRSSYGRSRGMHPTAAPYPYVSPEMMMHPVAVGMVPRPPPWNPDMLPFLPASGFGSAPPPKKEESAWERGMKNVKALKAKRKERLSEGGGYDMGVPNDDDHQMDSPRQDFKSQDWKSRRSLSSDGRSRSGSPSRSKRVWRSRSRSQSNSPYFRRGGRRGDAPNRPQPDEWKDPWRRSPSPRREPKGVSYRERSPRDRARDRDRGRDRDHDVKSRSKRGRSLSRSRSRSRDRDYKRRRESSPRRRRRSPSPRSRRDGRHRSRSRDRERERERDRERERNREREKERERDRRSPGVDSAAKARQRDRRSPGQETKEAKVSRQTDESERKERHHETDRHGKGTESRSLSGSSSSSSSSAVTPVAPPKEDLSHSQVSPVSPAVKRAVSPVSSPELRKLIAAPPPPKQSVSFKLIGKKRLLASASAGTGGTAISPPRSPEQPSAGAQTVGSGLDDSKGEEEEASARKQRLLDELRAVEAAIARKRSKMKPGNSEKHV
eukprot:m.6224 g.6224  ORF g.6224 m.6224 type:complete len:605 (+) comp15308_c0_seq2:26-1840(+)